MREQLWRTGRFYDFAEIFDPSIVDSAHSYFGFCAAKGIGMADILSISDANRLCDSFMDHLKGLARGAHVLIDVKFNSWHEVRAPWTYMHQEPHFLTYLKTRGAGFIFVRRRDMVQQILSERLADKTQRWHNVAETGDPPVTINVPHAMLLTEFFAKSEGAIFDFLRGYEFFDFIDYEDMFSYGTVLANNIKSILCNFAGEALEFPGLGVNLRNTIDKSSAIADYNTLCDVIERVVETYRHPELKAAGPPMNQHVSGYVMQNESIY